MKKPSEETPDWETQRNRIIGLGETSIRKSYYPELQQRIHELEKKNEELHAAFEELTATDEELRQQIEETGRKEQELRASEDRYHSLYANMIDGAALHELKYDKNGDPEDYVIIEINPAFEKHLGISRDRVIGKTSQEAYGVTRPPYLEIYARVVLTGEPEVFETYFPPLDKYFSIAVYRPSQGTFATIFEDITERKRADDALRESEEFLTSIVENIPLMLFVKDSADLRFVRFNHAGEELLGISRTEMIGKSDHDFFPKEQADFFTGKDRLVLEGKVPIDIPKEKIETQTHGERILHTRKIPILGRNGEPRFLLGISEDITERKRAEDALEKRLVALTQPMEGTGIAFEELFNIDEIQRIQDAFAQTMGVASVITHTDGTPITTPSNFTRLCNDIIRKSTRGCENCYKSDAVLGRPHIDGPVVQPCLSGGLWDAGASIVVGGQHIANWLIGQVRNETQNEEAIQTYAREIGVDEQTVLEAFREVPTMSSEKFSAIAQLLFIFANQLSKSAYQNVQQARFITDRKQAEVALRMSEERYRSLVDITDTGYLVLNNQGLVVDANGVYLRFTGRSSLDELVGHPVTEWTAPYDLEHNAREVQKCITTGHVRSLEIDYLRPDGTIQPVEINATVFHGDTGDVILTLCRDISDRKRIDIALQQARNKLTLLNAVTFQDIQTAAFSLAAYQELVKAAISDPKARSYLDKQEMFLKKMVDSLDFAKNYQEMGIHPPRWQNVRQVFLYAISHLDFLSMKQNLDLGNLEVFADPLFEKALFNIMQNVLRHGIRATEVTLRYVEHPESLVLIIGDNGVGIPAEEKHMIFDRGYGKDSGLGLFMVREVLSITGMSIRETGIAGQGTRFEISVPSGAYRNQ